MLRRKGMQNFRPLVVRARRGTMRIARTIRRPLFSTGPRRSIALRSGGYRGMPGGFDELKFVETANVVNFSEAAGFIQLLNGTVVGSQNNQRIGRKIVMKSIGLKGFVATLLPGVAPLQGVVTVSIVLDLQPNAVAATIADIYTTNDAIAFNNLDNRMRFKVLYTRTLRVDQRGSNEVAIFDKFMKTTTPVIYNAGTAGTIGDITSNALYLVCRLAGAVVPTQLPAFEFRTRVRYSDN